MEPKHLLCLSLSLASCSPLARLPPEGPRAAATAGVRLSLLDEPWRGEPHDLPEYMVAVAVEIHNGGSTPLEVRLADFVLTAGHGAPVHACLLESVLAEEAPPPPPLRGPLLATVGPPPSAAPDRPLALRGATAPPPPSDALRLALPEGPLAPGGLVRGFVFFPRAELPPGRPLHLRWRPHPVGGSVPLGELDLVIRPARLPPAQTR